MNQEKTFEPWIPQSRKAAILAVISALIAMSIPVLIASLFLVNRVADENQQQSTDLTQRLFTQVCAERNVAKALDRVNVSRSSKFFGSPLDAREPVPGLRENAVETTDALNVLLNCEATFRSIDGIGVPLSSKVERAYLLHVSEGFVPELENGLIVGKHRAETQGHTDF